LQEQYQAKLHALEQNTDSQLELKQKVIAAEVLQDTLRTQIRDLQAV
jgi:hypothetical protein